MSKGNSVPAGTIWGEFLQLGVHKGSQGRITRQLTFAAFAIGFVLAAYQLYVFFDVEKMPSWLSWLDTSAGKYAVPALVLFAGLWFAFRLVNVPRFADFLIHVEGEMNKVSWPTRQELVRSSIVVIFVIFSLALVLYGYDMVWHALFRAIGVLHGGGGG